MKAKAQTTCFFLFILDHINGSVNIAPQCDIEWLVDYIKKIAECLSGVIAKGNVFKAANTNLFVLILLLLGQWGGQKKSYL